MVTGCDRLEVAEPGQWEVMAGIGQWETVQWEVAWWSASGDLLAFAGE